MASSYFTPLTPGMGPLLESGFEIERSGVDSPLSTEIMACFPSTTTILEDEVMSLGLKQTMASVPTAHHHFCRTLF
ncbi:hypothetical protein Peur_013194 [Populus x canadensis]